jgi:hypothetical protein
MISKVSIELSNCSQAAVRALETGICGDALRRILREQITQSKREKREKA